MCKILITAFALTFLLNLNVAAADSTATTAPKSRGTALTYSIRMTALPAIVGGLMALEGTSDNSSGMTLFGLGLGSAGVLFGPGAGHAYAGRMGRFWGGAAIRGLAGALVFVGGLWIYGSSNFYLGSSSESDGSAAGGIVIVVGAGALFLTSAVYDIATVGRSADKYNHSHGFSDLRMTPTYFASHKAPGLMLTMSF